MAKIRKIWETISVVRELKELIKEISERENLTMNDTIEKAIKKYYEENK